MVRMLPTTRFVRCCLRHPSFTSRPFVRNESVVAWTNGASAEAKRQGKATNQGREGEVVGISFFILLQPLVRVFVAPTVRQWYVVSSGPRLLVALPLIRLRPFMTMSKPLPS